MIDTIVLFADGIEKVNEVRQGKHRSVTLWEGSRMVTQWRIEQDGKVLIEGTDSRELSEDGDTMTLRRHMIQKNSVTDMVIVLRKQLAH